ncbi:O-antigen ligase family protein [Halochromatium salexigens]|nr:O-antigen ligase family protein [Halochromatium salexigens]
MVAAQTAVSDSSAANPSAWEARARQGAEWVLGAVLVIAPLFLGGKPAWALLSLEVLSLAMIALVLMQPRPLPISAREGVAIALLLGLPWLYLLPLPAVIATWVPGHALYAEASALMMGEAGSGLTRLSVVPDVTESSGLFLWAPVGVFIVTRWLAPTALLRLVLLVLAVGLLQGLLGAVQFLLDLAPLGGDLDANGFEGLRSAAGTLSNAGHLAGLLNMVLALTLGLTAYGLEHRSRRRKRRGEALSVGDWLQRYPAIPYAVIAALLLAALLLTRSRVGIGLSILAVMIWTLLLAQRSAGQERWLGIPRALVMVAIGGALVMALLPLFDRFSVPDVMARQQGEIVTATLSGIVAFFPFGSGPGTYSEVFPAFQPVELGQWSISHAQNSVLEWVFEMGVLGAVLIVLGLAMYLRQWVRIGAAGPWPRQRFLQLGAGIGLLLALLQGLFDDTLQIPANVIYFAFLAGLFYGVPATQVESTARRARPRRTPDLVAEEVRGGVARRKGTRPPAGGQIPNPFLDDDASTDRHAGVSGGQSV